MMGSRVRAALVIGAIVLASGLAGAALDHRLAPSGRRWSGSGGPGRGSPEQDARRRREMLDRMTADLELSAPQRAGIDSVMQRTDSSLRAIRAQMQPRISTVFDRSRAEIATRLTDAQRARWSRNRHSGGARPSSGAQPAPPRQ